MNEEPESMPVVPKRRSGLPILVVFLLVLGGGAGAFWYLGSRPDPFKVLVSVDADGPWYKGGETSEMISEEIADGLDKIGFGVVKTDDRKAIGVLSEASSVVEAAEDLRAGFVISGTVDPEVIEHPVEKGFVEVRAKVTLKVHFLGAEGQDAEDTFTSWAGGPTKKDAMKLLGEQIASRAFDASVPRITGHPVVKAKLDAGDMQTLVRLDAAKQFADARARQLEDATKAYDELLAKHKEHRGPKPITYHGDFRGLDFLASTGPDGILINTQGKRAFFHPKRSQLEWINDLETVAWRGGDKDKVVWSGYHVLGYPAAAPDGSAALFVEDLFGHAKTLTVVDASGAARRVMVHESARFDNPEVAPGGKAAAMYVRLCYGCTRDFAVFSLADGKTLYRRDSAGELDEGYGGYAWLDEKRAVYVVRRMVITAELAAPAEELHVVDVSGPQAADSTLATLENERCSSPSASADGKKLVLGCAGTSEYRLVVIDTTTGERTETKLVGLSPSISPDGTRVAYTRGGDVFVGKLADSTEERLTENSFYERRALFSSDGKRVYFETQAEDPMFKSRTVGVVASVEAP